jgi:hypothetical protein
VIQSEATKRWVTILLGGIYIVLKEAAFKVVGILGRQLKISTDEHG